MIAMSDVRMVVIDGVRYRPEDVPKKPPKVEQKEADAPANKARTAANKKG